MKRIILSFAFFAMCLASCKKDPENQVFVSEDNLTGYIAGCVARENIGLFTQLDDATTWTLRGLSVVTPCSYTKDSTFSQSSPSTSASTYSFSETYHTDIQCNSTPPAPTLVHFSLVHNGVWQNAKAKGNGNGNGAWNVTGVTATDANLIFNGDYTRAGNATDKKNGNISYSTDLRMTLKNVVMDKTTKQLQSGLIEFSISGASSTTTDYDFIGKITITNHTTATLTIRNRTFNINLNTGEVV